MSDTKKPFRIGLIGTGFMGRAHSQRLSQGPQLLRPRHTRSCYRRSAPAVTAPPRPTSPRSVGLCSRPRPTGARPSSRATTSMRSTSAPPTTRHKEIAIAAAAGRQDRDVREAAGAHRGRGSLRWSRRSRSRRCPQHRLVQLPTRAGRHSRQAAHRRREARPHLPLPGAVPAGLDDLRRTCRRAGPDCGDSIDKAAGSGVTGDLLAHCIDTALWLNGTHQERSPR